MAIIFKPYINNLVTVIIPAHNCENYIEQTIQSVINQSYKKLQIIIINDGSTDGTSDRINKIYDPIIIVINQTNHGVAATRNNGLKEADGEFVAFIDHDDIWHPDKISTQVQALINSSLNICACFGNFIRWDGISNPSSLWSNISSNHLDKEYCGDLYTKLIETNWILLSTAIFRRSALHEVGNFDPELPPADDWDLVLKLSRRYDFIKIHGAVALYRIHPLQNSRRQPSRDIQTELRDSYLMRYGSQGKSGKKLDDSIIRQRRIKSKLSYISTLLSCGSLYLALHQAAKLTLSHPTSYSTWRMLIISAAKFICRIITNNSKGSATVKKCSE